MPRNLYGNSLPSVAESRDSDIFYDINTGKSYVFDNGQWNELPQEPDTGADVPVPTTSDRNKYLHVKSNANELEYKTLAEVPIPNQMQDLGKTLRITGEGYTLSTEGKVPVATAQDEGKVLGVDNTGAYALVEGGGSSVITLNVLYDSVEDQNYINASYNTLKSYMESGTPVVIIYSYTEAPEEVIEHGNLIGLTYVNDIANQQIFYRADFGYSLQTIASSPTDNMYISK